MSEDSKRLILNIEADASSAAEGLKTLSTALSDFKGSSDATSPMRKIADAVRQIREAAGLIEADTGAKLTALGRGLSEVAKVGTISLKATTSDRIGNIALASRLLQVDSGTKLTGLAEGLKSLSNVTKLGITQTTGKQIGTAAEAAHRIPEDVVHKLSALAEGMNALSKVEKSSMGTTVSQLRRLPEILKNIEDVDISKLKPQIDALTEAMKPLAVEMDKIARGFSAMPKKLQSYITSMERAAKSTSKLTSSAGGGGKAGDNSIFRFFYGIRGQLITYTYLVRRVMSLLGGAVNEANKFVEDINLFTVAMGKYTKEAMAYAERVQDVMGIDMGEWMRNQGVFKTMAQGFGIAEDAAYKMSKGLTELAYDTASFYNISFESAMEKFRSGLAGQPRPLRELGFAIDDATLSQIALSQGITESTRSMNQADKAMLRYTAVMSQQKNIMGDLARTMHTPANAMRLLGARATTLARTFGSILIPILSSVIPYLQVFLELLIKAAQAMAALFGFELPTIDYSGIQAGVGYADELADGFDNVGDSAGNAGQAIKEFKNYLLGFDEMHIIPSTSTADSGGGGLGGIGGSGIGGLGPQFDWELPEHSGFMAAVSEEIEQVRKQINGWLEEAQYWLEPLLPLLESVGIAFLINLGGGLVNKLGRGIFHYSDEVSGKISNIISLVGGIAVAWFGSKLLVSEYVSGNIDDVQLFIGILATLLTSVTMVGIALKNLGLKDALPWWLATLIVAGTLVISIVIHLENEKKLQAMRDVMGDIELSADEIKRLAREIIYAPWMDLSAKINTIRKDFSELQKRIANTRHDIQLMTTKIQLGIEVDPYEFETAVMGYFEDANASLQKALDGGLTLIDLSIKDPNLKLEIQTDFATFIGDIDSQIQQYGRDLRDLFYEGWTESSDAEQIMRNASEIVDNIQAQLNIVNRIMQEGEIEGFRYRADKSLADLDYDTYKEVIKESLAAGEAAKEERMGQYQSQVGMFSVMYEGDDEKRAEAVEQAKRDLEYDLDQIYLSFSGVGRDTMADLFSPYEELLGDPSTTIPEMKHSRLDNSSYNLYDNLDGERVTTPELFENYMRGITNDVDSVLNAYDFQRVLLDKLGFDDEAARDIAARFGVIMSTSADLIAQDRALFDSYMELGKQIPPELGKGLNDLAVMGALAGDYESFLHVLGMQFASSPEVSNLLLTVKGMGAMLTPEMRRGFYSNLNLIRDENGVVTSIKNIITGEVYKNTPEMQEIMKGLGVDTITPYIEGAEELLPEVAGVVEEVKETLHETGSGGGGGRKITWLESWLESLGLGLGEGEVIAREGSQSVEGAVEENVSPEKWNLLGWLSGESLGSGSAAGLINTLFGLGDAAGQATGTLSGELGTWGAVGGEGGSAAIKEAAQKLKDDAGLLNSAMTGSFRKLRDSINGQTSMLRTAMGNVTNGMMTPWNNWFRNVSDGTYKTMANVAKQVLSLKINKTAYGGSYNLQYQQPTQYYAQAYAEGGFPSAGELFLMNEREPEFLTTVGGRTSVVNQDQMSRSLEAAIARGMAASGGGGQTGDLIIQIDGKEHNLGNIAEIKRKNQRAGRAVIQVR